MMRASSFLQRFPILLLAALLVGLGVFLAHDTPPAAQAQASTNANLASLTASGGGSAGGAFTGLDLTVPTDVWSATLTAKELTIGGSSDGFGCDNTETGKECSSTSALTDDDFSLGGKDYSFELLHDVPDNSFIVDLTMPAGGVGDDLKALNFCVGKRAFALSGLSDDRNRAIFSDTDVGWAADEEVQLSIGASCDPTEYAATVDNSVTYAKLTPTVDDTGKATVQVGPQGGTLNTVTDGQPSAALALNVGANPFTVRVTAEDATTKDYTVTITRQAPGPVTLVSNHGQTPQGTSYGANGFVNAQAFTTGSHALGYVLSAVEAVVEGNAPTATELATIRAELWSVASGGAPNAKIADLTVPSSFSAGTVSFAAPANTVLVSGRSYFLMLYTTGNYDMQIDYVETGDEDSGAAAGWSIANDRYFKRDNQPGDSAAWENASSNPLRITVKGNEQVPMAPVWSAVLTVQDLGSGQFGCEPASTCATRLTDNDFTLNSNDYRFGIIVQSNSGATFNFIFLSTHSAQIGTDLQALNMCVGSTALGFSAAALTQSNTSATWTSLSLPQWAAGDKVHLSIGNTCPPGQPTGLGATAGAASLALAWTAPTAGTPTGYDVHYTSAPSTGSGAVGDDDAASGNDPSAAWVAVDRGTESDPPAASQSITGLTPGDTYRVRVRATNIGGSVGWVRTTGTPPATTHAPPTGLTVTAGDTQLSLSWTAPATGTVTGYDVHYTSSTTVGNDAPATGGGSATGWHDTSFTGTSTTDTLRGLSNGTTYRVRVRANYAGGDSAWVHRSATPMGTAPPPPPPPAPDTPTVRLSASPNPVDEGSSVTITATLSAAQTSALTIPVTITDDTAESGDHGTLTSIAINANATTGTGSITTAQDTDADHETFDVALGTPLPSGIAAGSPSSVRVTIADDEASTGPAFWTGTLTTGEIGNGLLGCQTPNMNLAGNQVLAHTLCSERIAGGNTFSHDGDTYRILGVHRTPPGRHDDGHQRFGLIVNRALPEDWVLVVDGSIWLSMRDTQWSYGTGPAPNASGRPHTWKGTNVSWTEDGTATLSLIKPEASTPTVALSASPETVLEGDTVTVTATLSAAASSAVTLRLRGELSSITIPPGQTEGTATFTAAEDTDHTGVSQWTEAQFDEVVRVAINAGLPPGVLTEPTAPRIGASSKQLVISVIDDDAPLPKVSLFAGPGNVINEGEEGYVGVTMSRGVHGDVSIPLSYTPGTAEPADYSGPLSLTIARPPTDANRGVITIPEDGDLGDAEQWEDFTVSIDAGALPNWLTAGSFEGNGGWGTSYKFTIHDTTPASGQQAGGQNDPPCDNCGTGGDTGAVGQGQGKYADLIAQMKEWRNDPEWSHQKAHTDRWDRALLAFGETVDDATLTPMAAAEAQGYADQDWGERWVPVAAALWELENQSPTVSNALADVTIVNESGTKEVSLSGVFDDADGDSLTITASSGDEAVATVSVSSDGSSLTVSAQARGTAAITATADDGKGGTVEDSFTVTVKAAPVVASAIADVSGLEAGATQDVSLSGVFSDADGDSLSVTAASSDETRVTVSVAADQSTLTLTGVAGGTATVTVTAQDSDGNRVSDAFEAPVGKYAALIAQMYQWREDPQWRHQKSHTDRWDRALLAFGETVADSSLTPMTAAEAQALADQDWGVRWVPVAAALWEIEGGGQQETPNAAPTVSTAISDATIVNQTGTQTVSLSGVFSDGDGDALTITAASSDEAIATVSVAADYATLTVNAQARGAATITVTAADGNGGTAEDAFTVTVKAAPDVASDIADVSGLEAGSTREVSLSGVFTDADGDALSVTASSSDEGKATVSVSSDGSTLTLTGVAEGTATITVIAQDSDGNPVMDDFAVTVVAQQRQQPSEPANEAPTVAAAISDATIVSESGTKQVSLAGVFSDADGDSLTVTAASSDEAKATVSVASDGSSLTVSAQARGTAVITVTANDGRGGTVSDTFTVTVKAAPVVASAIADMDLKAGATQNEGGVRDVTLSAVFSDADGDALTFTADTSDFAIAEALLFQGILTVVGLADGTATITVTAEDADGNTVSDAFDVKVVGPPTTVSNLSCVAQTDRVLFSWDAPQWSGAELYAYDYDLTRPDGGREQSRLQGYPAVSARGDYQAGQQASISVKAVYELADGSEVSSEAVSLSCTVAE